MTPPPLLSTMGFVEIPGCEHVWTRSFPCCLTLMRATRLPEQLCSWLGSSSPHYTRLSPARTQEALVLGQKDCQPQDQPWNGMQSHAYFSSFLPLMPQQVDNAVIVSLFLFLAGVCFPNRPPMKVKNRTEEQTNKNGKQRKWERERTWEQGKMNCRDSEAGLEKDTYFWGKNLYQGPVGSQHTSKLTLEKHPALTYPPMRGKGKDLSSNCMHPLWCLLTTAFHLVNLLQCDFPLYFALIGGVWRNRANTVQLECCSCD